MRGTICFKSVYAFAFVLILVIHGSECRVLELDERFREARNSGQWLVMFYAPWCGHCKQLEPIWMEVGEEMAGKSSVYVARLDCTKYASLSESFGIRGFPTIKYINADDTYEYNGPRTKNDILAFSQKAQGPSVTEIRSRNLIDQAKKKHEVFYLYVGDSKTELRKAYDTVASNLFISLSFYSIPSTTFPHVTNLPNVLVFKDDTYYEFATKSANAEKLELLKWVTSEQLPSFMELSGMIYHKIKNVGKAIAVFVLPEEDYDSLLSTGKELALQRKDLLLHAHFTFCWVKGNKIVNSLTYSTIEEPNVLVYNPQTYEYYVLNDFQSKKKSGSIFYKDMISSFLHKVIKRELSPRGGSGFLQQVKRFFTDILNMVVNLFRDSPVIGSLVIGVPTLVITFLCYCLCTMDNFEDHGYSTDSEDEDYEKKQQDDIDQLPEYDDSTYQVLRERKLLDEPPDEDADTTQEDDKDKHGQESKKEQ